MQHNGSKLPTKRRSKALEVVGAALAIAAFLVAGSVQAADKGVQHHAQGQYDVLTATYVVVEGDDLIAISERFEIPLETLKARNELASDTIDVGDKLAISGADARTDGTREAMKTKAASIPGQSPDGRRRAGIFRWRTDRQHQRPGL